MLPNTSSDQGSFIDEVLKPAIFDRLDEVFPQMQFQRDGRGWHTHYDTTLTPHRGDPGKCVCRTSNPFAVWDNTLGKSLELINLYRQLNGITDRLEACKQIAGTLGLQWPERQESEAHRKSRERREALERLAGEMQAALFTEEGKEVLDYLRNTRKYDDGFIGFAGFGYCSPAMADTITRNRYLYLQRSGRNEQGKPDGPPLAGNTHTLFFPFRCKGEIVGYVFRTISGHKQKYSYSFVEYGKSQADYLFGLMRPTPINPAADDRRVVLVEGPIDALRAAYAGVPNVFGLGGSTIYPRVIKEAKRLGATGVVLMLDKDETKEKRAAAAKKIADGIQTIKAEGLEAYVADLPQDNEAEKVDVDSYLTAHAAADLLPIVANAIPAPIWRYYQIEEKTRGMFDRGAENTDWYNQSKKETIALMLEPTTTPTERDMIANQFSQMWGDGWAISKEAILKEANNIQAERNKQRQAADTAATLAEALEKAKSGEGEAALSLVADKLPRLRQMSREAEQEALLHIRTREERRRAYAQKPQGIEVDLAFTKDGVTYPLVLPSGALTYICAQTSHGKSRMLENLAIRVVNSRPAESVLYFTLEESQDDVEQELLNVFQGEDLTHQTNKYNNLTTIQHYYRTGETRFIQGAKVQGFLQCEEAFNAILDAGRLRVYDRVGNRDVTALCEDIMYLCRTAPAKVAAVFVDYVQLLRKPTYKGYDKKGLLAEICEDLMNLSIAIQCPVILAAQLNREAASPLEMEIQQIADASNIEHSANTIVLLWSSNGEIRKDSKAWKDSKGKELSDEAQALKNRGFLAGQDGTLYTKIAKNRGGVRNGDAVWNIHPNSGRISHPGYKSQADPKPEPPTQSALPFPPPEEEATNTFATSFD